jgi:hypothetical protein
VFVLIVVAPTKSFIRLSTVCDYFCDYWKLSDSCFLSKVTYIFDNDSTVFFAIFMSFWGRSITTLLAHYSCYQCKVLHSRVSSWPHPQTLD